MAATRPDYHVAIFLQDDIGAVVKIQHRDAVELGGGTARLWDRVRVYEVNLHNKKENTLNPR